MLMAKKRRPARPAFTPVEARMIGVLSDGRPHRREQLHRCLVDELGEVRNIRAHITRIRSKIRPHGEDVQCVRFRRRVCYQLVRLLITD